MLPHENIVNDLCDGYGRGWCAGWICDDVSLQGIYIFLNHEEKERLYSQIVHVKTNQKINGVPNHSLKNAGTKRFKKRRGLWYPIKTSYLIKNSWGEPNQYIFRSEKGIHKNGRELGYSDDKIQVLEAYIPPTPKTDNNEKVLKTVIDYIRTAESFSLQSICMLLKCVLKTKWRTIIM